MQSVSALSSHRALRALAAFCRLDRGSLKAARKALSLLVVLGCCLGGVVSAHGLPLPQVFPVGVQSPIGSTWDGPVGVATDSSGNIYVAEHLGNDIVEVNAATHATSVLLTTANGTALNRSQQMVIDSNKNLYIADNGNNRVVVYSIPNATVTATYPVTAPFGLALDASGYLWIAGVGELGYVDKIAVGSATGTAPASVITSGLTAPREILVDASGNLYISDNTQNAVYEYTATSGFATQLTLISGLNGPNGMIFDAQGNIDIAEGSAASFIAIWRLGIRRPSR